MAIVYNTDSHQILGGSTLSSYDITGQANEAYAKYFSGKSFLNALASNQ